MAIAGKSPFLVGDTFFIHGGCLFPLSFVSFAGVFLPKMGKSVMREYSV